MQETFAGFKIQYIGLEIQVAYPAYFSKRKFLKDSLFYHKVNTTKFFEVFYM